MSTHTNKNLHSIYMRTLLATSCLLFSVAALAGNDHDHEHASTTRFIQNKGQWHEAVLFRNDVNGASVFLEEKSIMYVKLEDGAAQVMHDAVGMTEAERRAIRFKGHAWRMNFVDPSPEMTLVKGEVATTYHNYFLGNDPSKWVSRVPLFDEIIYRSVWPGVDMVLRTIDGHLKYDLIVAPGADITSVRFAYEGLEEMMVDDEGRLVLRTSVGEVLELTPDVFYADDHARKIDCRYELHGTELRFVFPNGFDPDESMIIDPTLIAATYSGSTGASNYGHCAAYDDFGNIYTGARNFGPSYAVTPGAFQSSFGGGGTDISVSKLNPDGSAQIWASYLGGNDGENPHSLIANSAGELIVLGSSNSSDFPITSGAYDATLDGGQDITVTRISSDGTTLIGSTFIGGSGMDGTNSIWGNYGEQYRGEVYLDQMENILLASFSSSSDFPVTAGALQATFGGGQDGVVVKLDPSCTELLASTYLGGSGDDAAMGIRLAQNGDLVVNGSTDSNDLQVTSGSYQNTLSGGLDAFLARLAPDLTMMVAGTYFGTSSTDRSYFIDVDSNGDYWIYGQTDGTIAIQPSGTYGAANGDIFIAKLSEDLSSAPVTTVVGGSLAPVAFLVDVCDRIYISGYAVSGSFPLSPDALYTQGGFYLSVFDVDMQAHLYGTYYGGSHVDGGTSRFDKNGIVYQGVCSGGNSMQTTSWAFAPNNYVSWDMGVFKIDMEQSGVQVNIQTDDITGCTPATFTFNGSGNSPVYYWDPGDGSPGSTGTVFTHTYTDPGVYDVTLIGIDPASCNVSDTTFITVTVSSGTAPAASFNVEVISSCDGLGASFTNTSTPASEISWEFGDGQSSNAPSPTHPYNSPGQYVVWLTIEDEICGGSDSTMTIIDIPPPYMEYELESPVYLCDGSTVQLSAGTGYESYYWSTTATTPTITVDEIGEYSVEVIDGLCSAMDTITVLAVPEVPKAVDAFGCPGLEITLSAPFTVSQITWSHGADSANTVVDLPGEYSFIAIDEFGCLRYDTIQVQMIEPEELAARVPNVFTPNNDGMNDKFEVMSLGIDQFRMEVYNRWGQMMYETSNPNLGWNGGVDNSADKVPDGTYYYIITFKDYCANEPLTTEKGHVTLLR